MKRPILARYCSRRAGDRSREGALGGLRRASDLRSKPSLSPLSLAIGESAGSLGLIVPEPMAYAAKPRFPS